MAWNSAGDDIYLQANPEMHQKKPMGFFPLDLGFSCGKTNSLANKRG